MRRQLVLRVGLLLGAATAVTLLVTAPRELRGAAAGPAPATSTGSAPLDATPHRPLTSAVLPPSMPEPAPIRLAVLTVRLGRNQTLAQALSRLSLGPGQAQAILRALSDNFPFRRSKPGDQLRVERVAGDAAVRRFTYRQSAASEWVVDLDSQGPAKGAKREVEITREVARVDVSIEGSVWESLQRAGEEPSLAALAADVLAFDVDFYQEVRAGDRLRLLVEKVRADGKLMRYGEILAAAYSGSVAGDRRLFRYTDAGGVTSYYDQDGRPARRGFLRSPLRYAHMTSGFGSRVHPILGYVKAHQGIDYAAPVGTPVMAIGDGAVAQAGWMGGCGKAVTLRHRNGLDSVYCHLSSIAVRPGAHISQRQLVGLVGQTGMATGPHLHFALRRAGAFVNPLSVKVPREAPLAPAQRTAFLRAAASLRAELEAVPLAATPAPLTPRG